MIVYDFTRFNQIIFRIIDRNIEWNQVIYNENIDIDEMATFALFVLSGDTKINQTISLLQYDMAVINTRLLDKNLQINNTGIAKLKEFTENCKFGQYPGIPIPLMN
jgi:hypothetical protein